MAWNFDNPSFPNFDPNIQHPVVDGTVARWDNSLGIPNVRNFHQRAGPFQSRHPGLPNADQAAGRGGGLTGPNIYDGAQFPGWGFSRNGPDWHKPEWWNPANGVRNWPGFGLPGYRYNQ